MSQPKNPVIEPKKAILLRGVPGSGKSFYAQFVYKNKGAKIISSDDMFFSMNSNKHVYDPRKEIRSHQYCEVAFSIACQANERLIVVDDFNIAERDLAYYKKVAEFYGYEVEIIRFPWPDPPTNWRLLSRSVCQRMQSELDSQSLKPNERLL